MSCLQTALKGASGHRRREAADRVALTGICLRVPAVSWRNSRIMQVLRLPGYTAAGQHIGRQYLEKQADSKAGLPKPAAG